MAGLQTKRGSGPKAIGEILPAVLAKLGLSLVSSIASGEADSSPFNQLPHGCHSSRPELSPG